MKHVLPVRCSTLFSLLGLTISSACIAQSDSLTPGDTIHLTARRSFLSTFREYSYHYASHLSDAQLDPLLRDSPDPTVQRFVQRGRLANAVKIALHAAGASLTIAGFLTPRYPLERSSTLLLSGVGFFYAGFIPHGQMRRHYQQAVTAHNTFLRNRTDEFFTPYFSLPTEAPLLSLADTVSISRQGFSRRYTYRQIQVFPAWQLTRLADRLNDKDVKNGFQYSRRISSIGGFIGSFGASYLTTSLLAYGTRRGNGNSASLNTPLFWGSVAAIT